jgi:hypothetical protein
MFWKYKWLTLETRKTPVSQSFREFLFKQNPLLKAVPILVSQNYCLLIWPLIT